MSANGKTETSTDRDLWFIAAAPPLVTVRVFKLDGGGYVTVPHSAPHRYTDVLEPQGATSEQLEVFRTRTTKSLEEARRLVSTAVRTDEAAARRAVESEVFVRSNTIVSLAITVATRDGYMQGRRDTLAELKAKAKAKAKKGKQR